MSTPDSKKMANQVFVSKHAKEKIDVVVVFNMQEERIFGVQALGACSPNDFPQKAEPLLSLPAVLPELSSVLSAFCAWARGSLELSSENRRADPKNAFFVSVWFPFQPT